MSDHEHSNDDHDGSHHRAHGMWGRLTHFLRPHSHDVSDSVDSVLESSQEGIAALSRSFIALLVTALIQAAVVVASGSVALLADTIHNFADALTAIPLGIAFWIGRRPPTRRYTYGFGRAEDLAGLFVLFVIAASSIVAAWESAVRFIHPQSVNNLIWVMLAGVIGFAGNELVAIYRIRVGKRIGSAALVADGLHARTDALTSLAVVLGAIGVSLGWKAADPVVGLVITVAILGVLRTAARDIYRRLMDSVEPEKVDDVEHLLSCVPGIESIDAVRMRWIGHRLYVEAEVVCSEKLSLAEAHEIGEQARHRLLHAESKLTDATIHVSPSSENAHSLTAHHFATRSVW